MVKPLPLGLQVVGAPGLPRVTGGFRNADSRALTADPRRGGQESVLQAALGDAEVEALALPLLPCLLSIELLWRHRAAPVQLGRDTAPRGYVAVASMYPCRASILVSSRTLWSSSHFWFDQ